jgi:hypothetical protein
MCAYTRPNACNKYLHHMHMFTGTHAYMDMRFVHIYGMCMYWVVAQSEISIHIGNESNFDR